MIQKDSIDYLADRLDIKVKEIIEKDLLLHSLLCEIESNNYFRENLAFKGGTCLIKCYLGYYRLSEDLDFTWINQAEFKGKSQKEIRKLLSTKIDKILLFFKEVSDKLGFVFKIDKKDKKYIEFGGGNKFITLKLWYTSVVLNTEYFIKIQVNFVELILYPITKARAKNILGNIDLKEFKFLFPEDANLLSKKPVVKIYNIKEILIEKIRAILTRRGVKSRDFIDVFLIVENKKLKLRNLKPNILKKTRFMLRYEKYIQNLKDFQIERFVLEEESSLMLKPISKNFETFIKDFRTFLIKLVNELQNKPS